MSSLEAICRWPAAFSDCKQTAFVVYISTACILGIAVSFSVCTAIEFASGLQPSVVFLFNSELELSQSI